MKSKLSSSLKEADSCIADSGMKLRKKVKKFAEGGKVAALSGLRNLAKKFENALEMEDHAQAARLARQMESVQPGSSRALRSKIAADTAAVSREKAATFAKGGKVKVVEKIVEKVKSKEEPDDDDLDGMTMKDFAKKYSEGFNRLSKKKKYKDEEE